MKRSLLFVFLIIIVIGLTINGTMIFGASSVVSQNGQLKVVSGQLCNSGGSAIQLKGMSSMGLQWYPWSAGTVKNLVDTWGVTVVRAACYVTEGGYLSDPTGMTNKVKTVVDAAIANGIYVIVDWHTLSDTDPNTNLSSAKTFFQNITSAYGTRANVIYEICNEPNGSTTWAMIKTYANAIIPVIRANAPNSVIVVGTPTWSQDVRSAADSQLTYGNICYTLHFYAGTHGQSLRDAGNYAISKGAAIFVTEWGTSQASGSGGVYETETRQWVEWMNSKKISWCNWSLCPKDETSAALTSSASIDGPWSDSVLSTSGKLVKSLIGGGINPTTPVRTATPRITATPSRTATAVRTATPRSGATPTPVPSNGGLKVQFFNQNTAATTNQLYTNFKLVNTGSGAVALSNVKMRYYYTVNGSATQTFSVDYASVGSSNVSGAFVTISSPKTGADTYLEVSFASGAGSLAAGGNAAVQGRINKSNWTNYTQTDDYSFNSSATAYVDWAKTTAYLSGSLVWGTEP
jgi:endoglucanase